MEIDLLKQFAYNKMNILKAKATKENVLNMLKLKLISLVFYCYVPIFKHLTNIILIFNQYFILVYIGYFIYYWVLDLGFIQVFYS